MACIRWLNASITVLSYFNNLILISSFFGLGVGCLLATRKYALLFAFPWVLLGFAAVVLFLNTHGIEISYQEDVVFVPSVEYYDTGVFKVSLAALLGFFANMLLFVVLGQELGKQLAAVGDPLRAYTYDIGGSAIGVVAYSILAWTGSPPHIWFAVGALALCLLFTDRRRLFLVSLLAIAASLILISRTYVRALWSPYYKVEAVEYRDTAYRSLGYRLLVDNLRIQDALNFSPELEQSVFANWIWYYQLPYHFVRPRKVLILGAGSGNESVMALAHGAREIHVVEIDPVLARFGVTLHPNRPYVNPGVKVVVDDARAFISRATERYDLILMSALDSHKQVGGMSSLRLESFVYTVESYRGIGRLLAPGGVFCLSLGSTRPWMGERTYRGLTDAFGREPLVFASKDSPFNSVTYVLVNGDLGPDLLPGAPAITRLASYPPGPAVRRATDNWPYPYLKTNRVPGVALLVVVAAMLASATVVVTIAPSVRRPNLHFFFLGAGFMLLETRSITQMSLLFGATWRVNAVVFLGVLLTILGANQLVRRNRGLSSAKAYALLFITLIAGYLFPFEVLLAWPPPLRVLGALVAVGLPIFWSAFIFSNSFAGVERVNTVFGSNLLGVVCGGALEYSANVWGLNVLYLLAGGLYLASLVSVRTLRGAEST